MPSVRDLVANKDGMALKALALEGDCEAALGFSELVVSAKYSGDTSGGRNKKAAKDEAREDAIELVRSAADTGHYPAMQEWAGMNFEGRREPGPHGGRVSDCHFSVAETLYQNLLDHPECTEDQRAGFLFRKGTAIRFASRIKGEDRQAEVIELWEAGRSLSGPDVLLCAHALSDLYWSNGEFEKAVTHARDACEAHPYAHLTLFQAYKAGKGVEQDLDASRRHYDMWHKTTAGKS